MVCYIKQSDKGKNTVAGCPCQILSAENVISRTTLSPFDAPRMEPHEYFSENNSNLMIICTKNSHARYEINFLRKKQSNLLHSSEQTDRALYEEQNIEPNQPACPVHLELLVEEGTC